MSTHCRVLGANLKLPLMCRVVCDGLQTKLVLDSIQGKDATGAWCRCRCRCSSCGKLQHISDLFSVLFIFVCFICLPHPRTLILDLPLSTHVHTLRVFLLVANFHRCRLVCVCPPPSPGGGPQPAPQVNIPDMTPTVSEASREEETLR